jgi:hypothetical protein
VHPQRTMKKCVWRPARDDSESLPTRAAHPFSEQAILLCLVSGKPFWQPLPCSLGVRIWNYPLSSVLAMPEATQIRSESS